MTVVVLSHSFSECPLCYTIRVDILIMNAWKVITPIHMINFKRLKNQRMLSLHGLDDYSQDKVTFTARTCSKNGSILNQKMITWELTPWHIDLSTAKIGGQYLTCSKGENISNCRYRRNFKALSIQLQNQNMLQEL